MPVLLVVTNDPGIGELAQASLTSLGYEVVTAPSAEAAGRRLFSIKLDAAIVDTALREDLAALRERLSGADGTLPVVFLASAGSRWLPGSVPARAGLDEIVVKPCSAKEVRQAVERVLAGSQRSRPNLLLVGDLQLDRSSHELRGNGFQISLTPTEFRLMEYLAQRQGAIASSEELLEKVWEFYPGTGSSELVRSHVRNLRAKIRMAMPDRELIQTVPRRGYRLS